MFTVKNGLALALFLFGTTFLWMTRDFLADRNQGIGTLWSAIQVLALLAIVGFSIAGWLVFKEAAWEPVALVAAIVGLGVVVPYLIGITRIGDVGDPGVQINIGIHVVGIAAVFAGVIVPAVHDWITKRV